MVHAQALERTLDRGPDVVGVTVDAPGGGVRRVHDDPELGGQDYLVAAPGQRLADHPLAGVGSVDVGRIEHGDPEFEGAADDLIGIGAVETAVDGAEAHAAEADGAGLQAGATEGAGGKGHGVLLVRG